MGNKVLLQSFEDELRILEEAGNLRQLPSCVHHGQWMRIEGHTMLNLSSNDYLGLANDKGLRETFLATLSVEDFIPSASSSRLLTGNFLIYQELESLLSHLFGTESALVFNSGCHMNMGILPAVSDSRTLILADKLVHASIIDGIRLSPAKCIRYRHTNYEQLESLVKLHQQEFNKIIIVTESIFSMDGDEADLCKLVELKKRYRNILLYVDEAHGIGVRGKQGLGCAEEQNCIDEIDFLTGTFGKALASVGAYVVCKKVIRDYLVNKMRTLIFTTALPPVNLMWTKFVLENLAGLKERREHLKKLSDLLRNKLIANGYVCPSTSHILPLLIGNSHDVVIKAGELQARGFYVLPVRPPTVPEGTSRIRLSLTASMKLEEIENIPIDPVSV